LAALLQQGAANGVDDLRMLSAEEIARKEPLLRCDAAMFSPSTGIVDTHSLILALQAKAEAQGAVFVANSEVCAGEVSATAAEPHTLLVRDASGGSAHEMRTRCVINAAGLWAQRVAASLEGWPAAHVPPLYPAKGSYFALKGGKAPCTHLVYPMPEPGGLGVHLTLDLDGQARFGPDVEWLDPLGPLDYDVDPERAESFGRSIRRYLPSVEDDTLVPSYSGIRPKLSPKGAAAVDFHVSGPSEHSLPGVVGLFGIESPGITASLALAKDVAVMLDD